MRQIIVPSIIVAPSEKELADDTARPAITKTIPTIYKKLYFVLTRTEVPIAFHTVKDAFIMANIPEPHRI